MLLASACALAIAAAPFGARPAELPEAIRNAGTLRISVNAIHAAPLKRYNVADQAVEKVMINAGE